MSINAYSQSQQKSWEKYFTDKSIGVEIYEIDYKSSQNSERYRLKLRVSRLNYGNCCAWELITNQTNMKISYGHPFERIDASDINFHDESNNEIYIGGINADNIVMQSLFTMIMMSDKDLSDNCGHLDSKGYRSRLIKILHDLWD